MLRQLLRRSKRILRTSDRLWCSQRRPGELYSDVCFSGTDRYRHHNNHQYHRLRQAIIITLQTPKAIIVPHRIIRSWYTGRWWVGCYIWYSEEGPGRAAAPPSPLLAVPNVTTQPSTTSVPINGPLLCGFNVAIKRLTHVTLNDYRTSDCLSLQTGLYILCNSGPTRIFWTNIIKLYALVPRGGRAPVPPQLVTPVISKAQGYVGYAFLFIKRYVRTLTYSILAYAYPRAMTISPKNKSGQKNLIGETNKT